MYLLTLLMIAFFLPMAPVGSGIRKQIPPYAVVFQSGMTAMAGMIALFGLARLSGTPLGETVGSDFAMAAGQALKDPWMMQALRLSGMESGGAQVREVLEQMYAYAANALPATILCLALLMAYCYYRIFSGNLAKKGHKALLLPPFDTFSLPPGTLPAMAVLYLLFLLTGMVAGFGQMLIISAHVVMGFLFCVQGMAVSLFVFRLKKLPEPLPAVLCAALFLFGPGRIFLSLAGILDLIINIRKKLQTQK